MTVMCNENIASMVKGIIMDIDVDGDILAFNII